MNLMIDANGTYETLTSTRAIVEVTYSNGLFGVQLVEVRYGADLYEACYSAASAMAFCHDERLGSFRRDRAAA